MSDDTLKSATRAFSGKDYYPTIAQLVWASEDDVNKILIGQQKSSLTCLLRQCLSQLKESLNKEQTMTDIVSTLSTGIGELKACIPKIESSVERVRDEVESVRANVTEIKAAECNIRLLQSHMRLKKNRPYNHWLKGQGHYLLCFSTSRTVGASSVRL